MYYKLRIKVLKRIINSLHQFFFAFSALFHNGLNQIQIFVTDIRKLRSIGFLLRGSSKISFLCAAFIRGRRLLKL